MQWHLFFLVRRCAFFPFQDKLMNQEYLKEGGPLYSPDLWFTSCSCPHIIKRNTPEEFWGVHEMCHKELKVCKQRDWCLFLSKTLEDRESTGTAYGSKAHRRENNSSSLHSLCLAWKRRVRSLWKRRFQIRKIC